MKVGRRLRDFLLGSDVKLFRRFRKVLEQRRAEAAFELHLLTPVTVPARFRAPPLELNRGARKRRWRKLKPEALVGSGDSSSHAVDHGPGTGDKRLASEAGIRIVKDPETFVLVGIKVGDGILFPPQLVVEQLLFCCIPGLD